jgi:hypothetical protein
MSLIKALKERIQDINRATDLPDMVEPIIYPPLTEIELEEAESEIGFRLPELLRRIYLEVGNGGFGPSYGLLIVKTKANSANFKDDHCSFTLVDTYKSMSCDNKNKAISDEGYWPDKLLPIIFCGCEIFICVDCTTSEGTIVDFATSGRDEDTPLGACFGLWNLSIYEFFEAWLRGGDYNLKKEEWGETAWEKICHRKITERERTMWEIYRTQLRERKSKASLCDDDDIPF